MIGDVNITGRMSRMMEHCGGTKVEGMYCANCEVLIERRFKKLSPARHREPCTTSTVDERDHRQPSALVVSRFLRDHDADPGSGTKGDDPFYA